MAPLGTMLLGIVVLKERPSTAQYVALGLAGAAVIELTVSYGEPPVAALIMAVTWSLYGLFKRQIPLPAVEGFAAESFVLFIPSAILVAALAGSSGSIARTGDARELVLMCFAGLVTAVPLILFAYAAARVQLTVLGVLQYLVPVVNFALGWLLYGEELPWSRLFGFALVWIALIVVSVDGVRTGVARRAARVAAVSAD
jgi:chloramphenicol-sensitive protein RarD